MFHTIEVPLDEAQAILAGRKTFHYVQNSRKIECGDLVGFVSKDLTGHEIPDELSTHRFIVMYVGANNHPYGQKMFSFSLLIDEEKARVPFTTHQLIPDNFTWPRFEDGRLLNVGDDTDCGRVCGIEFGYGSKVCIHTQPYLVTTDLFELSSGETIRVPGVRVGDSSKQLFKPVRVGETLYDPESKRPYEVVGFRSEIEWRLLVRDDCGHTRTVRGDDLVRHLPETEEDDECDQGLA